MRFSTFLVAAILPLPLLGAPQPSERAILDPIFDLIKIVPIVGQYFQAPPIFQISPSSQPSTKLTSGASRRPSLPQNPRRNSRLLRPAPRHPPRLSGPPRRAREGQGQRPRFRRLRARAP
ncbi:hypothetical protein EDC01DRAFT_453737 [Geopyxis carbonaria]|nr:hypothetical protein EDC01DRAFT_453737 [Geopyxis carbonaria]